VYHLKEKECQSFDDFDENFIENPSHRWRFLPGGSISMFPANSQ